MILPNNNLKVDTRNFFNGGLELTNNELKNFDPLVTGYAFICWISLPSWLATAGFGDFKQLTERNFKSLQGISDIELESQAYQYGFADNEYHVASNITKANTEITIKHQEFSGSPIKNAYQAWVSGIRDPETGIATYPALYDLEYKAANHTGEFLYIVTRPDGNTANYNNIEFAAYFTNVFPTRIPLAHLNYDQGDKSVVEIEIPLKCNMHISKYVDEYALVKLKELYSFRSEGLFRPDGYSELDNKDRFITTSKNHTSNSPSYADDAPKLQGREDNK